MATSTESKSYIAALDVGTTTIRCHIYNQDFDVAGKAQDSVHILNAPHDEIDPEQIFMQCRDVIRNARDAAGISASQIASLGMSCQRSSFVTWNKTTGEPFHNVITWRDLRGDSYVKSLNESIQLKILRTSARLAYTFTRQKRFLAASNFKVMNNQVIPKLKWVLDNNEAVKGALARGNVAFGTLDSWLLYKLSGQTVHATDVSQASCTGFYDPFLMDWSYWIKRIANIPDGILPQVKSTDDSFGFTPVDLFGESIQINCSIADQSASMFGIGCINRGDVKFTLGTGAFVDVNTADEPHCSLNGIYPIVGWRCKGKTVYMAEGSSNDTGSIVTWAENVGLIANPQESDSLSTSVESTDGVYFVPAFSGIQAPIDNSQAATGIIGLKPTTRQAHIVRALLESIAFRVDHIYEIVKNELGVASTKIRVDGGVSQNKFVTQLLADLTSTQIETSSSHEMTVLGVAFISGLKGPEGDERITRKRTNLEKSAFEPTGRDKHQTTVNEWRRAVERFLDWYQ